MTAMRYVLTLLAVLGILASSLALREHYRTDPSPCCINDKWDCGIVNQSAFAVMWGIPVACIGIAGYLLLGLLAWRRAYRLLLVAALAGLGFSLPHHIEAKILQVWCIYCVASLAVISTITMLSIVATTLQKRNVGTK